MEKYQVSPMNHPDDLVRLRGEYENRKLRFAGRDEYSRLNLANFFAIQQRQRAILNVFRENRSVELSKLKILEMGCGNGGILLEFLEFGLMPTNLYGVDLLPDRIMNAHKHLIGSHFINSDGQFLPFPSHSFDLVMQFTALSSVLDLDIRRNICSEMLRVVDSLGVILWYDFWLNLTNHQTHGIRPSEIRMLFPNCIFEFHKIALAPPLARRIVPVSWILALFLEKLKIFNSHYLVAIHKK